MQTRGCVRNQSVPEVSKVDEPGTFQNVPQSSKRASKRKVPNSPASGEPKDSYSSRLGVLLLEVAVAQGVAVGVFQLEVAVVEGQVYVETGEVMIMVTKERNIHGGIFLMETTLQLQTVKRKRKERKETTAEARKR